MKNYFIVFDGMDGSGKSEMVARLQAYLFKKNKDFQILTTREPSSGKYGQQIREMLAQEKDPLSNKDRILDLFIQDRQEHLTECIEPFLSCSNPSIVLCDRYYYSTLAFQQTQGISFEKLWDLNKDFRTPDLAFILDLDPSIALERMGGRDKEKFEQQEFMQALRTNFLQLSNKIPDTLEVIDSSQSKDQVFEEIKQKVDTLMMV